MLFHPKTGLDGVISENPLSRKGWNSCGLERKVICGFPVPTAALVRAHELFQEWSLAPCCRAAVQAGSLLTQGSAFSSDAGTDFIRDHLSLRAVPRKAADTAIPHPNFSVLSCTTSSHDSVES